MKFEDELRRDFPDKDRKSTPRDAAGFKSPDGADEGPHSIEAEKAMLGFILLDAYQNLRGVDTSENRETAFRDARHELIYRGVMGLRQEGAVIDRNTIRQRLADQNLLIEAGGESYIAEIYDAVSNPEKISRSLEVLQEQ